MSENDKTIHIGCGFGGFSGMLTIAFIVLKLCKVIDWSWIWVLAPAWISIAAPIVFILLFLVFMISVLMFTKERYYW